MENRASTERRLNSTVEEKKKTAEQGTTNGPSADACRTARSKEAVTHDDLMQHQTAPAAEKLMSSEKKERAPIESTKVRNTIQVLAA